MKTEVIDGIAYEENNQDVKGYETGYMDKYWTHKSSILLLSNNPDLYFCSTLF